MPGAMSLTTCIVLVRGSNVAVHAGGEAPFERLLAGPAGVAGVAGLPALAAVPERLDAGWLADLDARRVVLFDAGLAAAELVAQVHARWQGFEVRWSGEGDLAAYAAGERAEFEAPSAERLAALSWVPESRRAALGELEAGEPTPAPERPRGRAAIVAAIVLVLPFALVVRLLTAPWRRRLREQAQERERRRGRAAIATAVEQCERAADEPDALFRRGVALLAAGRHDAAELAFDACVGRLAAGEPATTRVALALHDRGVARRGLGLPRLAARDLQRAAELEPALAGPRGASDRARAWAGLVRAMFRAVAGLDG